MQTLEDSRRQAEKRRYLAERRIRYGNAASDSNMRNHPVNEVVHFGPFPINLNPKITPHACPRVSLSSAFSWQLGRSFQTQRSPLEKKHTPPPKMPSPPVISAPAPRVRWSTIPEYEKLQRQALVKSQMVAFREDEAK